MTKMNWIVITRKWDMWMYDKISRIQQAWSTWKLINKSNDLIKWLIEDS
jgi:hypothetical protein